MIRSLAILLGLTLGLVSAQDAPAAKQPKPVRVLLLDGQNNHDGPRTSAHLRAIVAQGERFSLTTATTPPRGADAAAWDAFRPDFDAVDVVLLNYNGEMWPERVRKAFVAFIERGGGALAVHASNNAFARWEEYDQLIALGWRGAGHGKRVVLDDVTGKPLFVGAGEGRGAGHGRQHPFVVTVRAPEHPIMKGLGTRWMHAKDELYHGQRGPAEGMTVLSSAFSDPKTGGTGKHEPITWFTTRGKGRFVTTVLGHLWKGQKEAPALRCAGFQTVVRRSLEWAATGRVTLEKPRDFPGAKEVSLRKDLDG